MGLHDTLHHGRVFRGNAALEHLHAHKRDSHGSEPVMNIPEGFSQKQAANNNDNSGVTTVVNVVFVTAPADFSGTTAGFSTVLSDNPQQTSTTPTAVAAAAVPTTSSSASDGSFTSDATAAASDSSSASLDVATSTTLRQHFSPVASTTTAFSSYATSGSSASSAVPNASLFLNAGSVASATAAVTSGAVASDGMTGGAKAGLAFGIIAGLAMLAGLIFFCVRRRKNPNSHEELNEKRTSSIFGGVEPINNRMSEKVAPSVRSTRTASTAPRLSLRPVTQFLPNLGGENRKSGGNLLGIGGAAAAAEKPKSAWERRPTGTDNPFDDNEKSRSNSPTANPFDEPEAAAAANADRTSLKSNGSGNSSSGSANGAAAVGRAGPPPGPNNVHRVQLDFKPSMEDELELKSGQLVRMLHEYDDGWALCVRMDRSQQGVTPRTCLSKLPVKPRPQGPPNGRQGPPPQGMRGPEPHAAMVPRPLTPNDRERMNNGPKPVPGQAL